jgi:ProP effector
VDPVVLTIGKLQKRFPKAFPKNPSPKVPLKIGIFEDLLAHATELALTETELRAAIKIWCRGSRYWTSMVEGAIRVDLAGEEGGRVSPEDGVRATKLEEGRLARVASKAAAPEKAAVAENVAVPVNPANADNAAVAENPADAEKAATPENGAVAEKAAVSDSEKVVG